MNVNQDTIRALAGLTHELDNTIKTIHQTLVRLELAPEQRAAAEALTASLWAGSSQTWELLHNLDRCVPPFSRHLPDDWPLAG